MSDFVRRRWKSLRCNGVRALPIAAAGLMGWSGTVLIGGPMGAGGPRLEAALAGGAVVILTHAWWQVARSLLTALPFVGLAAALYLSQGLNHLVTVNSQLGWLLTAGMVAAVGILRGTGQQAQWRLDVGLGGAVGLAGAVPQPVRHLVAVAQCRCLGWRGMVWRAT